jgi:hypothetical protein
MRSLDTFAPRSQRCAGSREAQSREPVKKGKNLPVYSYSIDPGLEPAIATVIEIKIINKLISVMTTNRLYCEQR